MTIQRASPEIVGTNEKCLFYGEPGTGKTFAAHTAPGPIFTLVIGPPNEIKTIFSRDYKKKHPEKEIWTDFAMEDIGRGGIFRQAEAFDKACVIIDEALEKRESGDMPEWQTIIVDNATVLEQVQMNKVLDVGAMGEEKGSKALKKLQDSGMLIPADYDYMGAQSLMTQFADWIFNLPVHVVFVAHEYQETTFNRKTRQTVIRSVKPLFVGKQRTEIPRMFDNVWRFTAEGGRTGRFFQAQTVGQEGGDGNPTIIAKTRMGGVLPALYRDVNLTEAFEKLQKAAQEGSDD